MLKVLKPAWLIAGMILLAVMLNVMIIKIASVDNQRLLWMLIVSLPLLLIAIYHAWQTHIPSATTHRRLTWLSPIASTDLKVRIGNDECRQPYHDCILNVGSMDNIYQLTVGGLARQSGSHYPGGWTENGCFNSEAFKKTAHQPEVKMIELQLSSPIERKINNTPCRDTEGMLHFVHHLRELSDGKPIGVRLCLQDKKEFYQFCHAARKTQLAPDFIVVDYHFESPSKTGIPLYDALLFVSRTLQVYGLQHQIKVIADGKIISSFDILKVLALGADAVRAAMPRYTPNHHVADFHDQLMNDTIKLMRVFGFKCVSDITLSKFFSRLDDVLQSNNLKQLNGGILYQEKKYFQMYTS